MTCICGHHAHAHAQDVGLCGSPHGCDCNRFVKAKPESPAPKRFAEMTPMELHEWFDTHLMPAHAVFAALRDAIRAEAIAERAPMEDTITALRARAERAEQERDAAKAKQDAEWLAGSEADTAQRNLARAYLAMRDEVAGFMAMWEEREKAHDAEIAEAKRERDAEIRGMVEGMRIEKGSWSWDARYNAWIDSALSLLSDREGRNG